jgi:hypothetical protein
VFVGVVFVCLFVLFSLVIVLIRRLSQSDADALDELGLAVEAELLDKEEEVNTLMV